MSSRIPAAPGFSPDQYRALQEGAGFLPRTDRGRLLLRGEDRKTYLQGLLSNDVASLEPDSWCYATLLTPQGRMISDMRVFELGTASTPVAGSASLGTGEVLLDLEAGVTEAVREHLDKFVITEDVTVEDVSASLSQVGLYGPKAGDVLAGVRERGIELRHVLPGGDIGVDGVELIIDAGTQPALLEALEATGAVRISLGTAEVTRIEAGIPRFLVDMDTSTIPLEAGIEDRAISLTKGCYVGQEVIIRVLHRGGGRVAKKLVRLAVDAPDAGPGDLVYAGDREVGRITSAVDSPKFGKRVALAYVHRDFAEPGTALTIKGAGAASV
ncbi:MAG: glycine cleavage T C-terminal barrel domain-containing protein [Vicinamibacterales bacterium]